MSANLKSLSAESKTSDSYINDSTYNSKYALYLFNTNKHTTNPEIPYCDKKNAASKPGAKTDLEESNICLTLLAGNVDAKQENVVRCYLSKTLSAREDLSFENEGKCVELQFNDNPEQFGCYYHKLSKFSEDDPEEDVPSKHRTFFICLIGPSNTVMESFCPEMGRFCQSLIALLDHEGPQDKEKFQLKLESWYFSCVEFITRCLQNFTNDIPLIILCALWGDVEVISENELHKWDVERFIDKYCLMPNSVRDNQDSSSESSNSHIVMNVFEKKIEINKSLDSTPRCIEVWKKLQCCDFGDQLNLHGVLDQFRTKSVQDLNTLKRLLQKAQADYYSLYRAFVFLESCGYENILLHHVKREACMAKEKEVLNVIVCLQDFLNEMKEKNKPDSNS